MSFQFNIYRMCEHDLQVYSEITRVPKVLYGSRYRLVCFIAKPKYGVQEYTTLH